MMSPLVAELPPSKDSHLDSGRLGASVKTRKPESSALIILLIPSFYIMGNIHVFTGWFLFFVLLVFFFFVHTQSR